MNFQSRHRGVCDYVKAEALGLMIFDSTGSEIERFTSDVASFFGALIICCHKYPSWMSPTEMFYPKRISIKSFEDP